LSPTAYLLLPDLEVGTEVITPLNSEPEIQGRADLEEVEEVCGCAVDADCILVCGWSWVGEVGYSEI
jgi:hypothetical protein